MDYIHEWNRSYENKGNYSFYPNEEVIRFVNKYIVKRWDIEELEFKISTDFGIKGLDVGSGIGRHIKYGIEQGIDMYGIELSSVAVETAKHWLKTMIQPDNLIQGSATKLPWEDNFFNVAISHAVLDSMSFEVAKEVVKEVARVLQEGSYFYCDLIAGDYQNFYGEKIVEYDHERGTIQSYFNPEKIYELFNKYFEIIELKLNETTYLKGQYEDQTKLGRYHVVLLRKVI